MAPREYPLTAAYAKFVNAGLIEHIGRNGKQADLPDGIKNATQDLTPKQKAIIEEEIGHEIVGILEGLSAVQAIPGYQGTSEDAKKFLQEILELAEKANIDNAHAALEKVNLFNPAALETEDMEVEDAPQPNVSESLAPVDAAAAQVKETKPEEESREEEAPGVASPEEEAPGLASPEEDAPGVASPEEETPGVDLPEQQARSGIRRYRQGRRLQDGETVEEIEEQNIPWTTGDPHDWPWPTYELPNGGAIMAEKTTERKDSQSKKISYYLIEVPVEKEKDGVLVTLYQHKLVRYSDYPDAIDKWKQKAAEARLERCVFAATDKEDPETRRITRKRDAKSYKFLRLEFTASLTPLTKKKETQTSLTPETECVVAVEEHDKPVFLSMTQFKRLVGDKKAKLLISRVCGRDGLPQPGRTEARRISELNRACPDNADELEYLENSRASLPHGEQGVDENALFGRVQAYVDRRFADFTNDIGAAVASSIANEMEKMTRALGTMIEAQIQTQMYEVRGSDENRETSSSANAASRYNIAISDKLRDALQGSSSSSRERERTLPPYSSPNPPRSLPVRRSIEA